MRLKVEVLHRHCAEVGRDPAAVRVTHLGSAIGGDRDEHVGRYREFAEAGVQTAIVRLRDLDVGTIERFADVISEFPA